MYLFNSKCQIQKYKSAIDIIKYFYEERLPLIEKRKKNILNELINDINIKENKIRFIKDTIEQKIKVSELTKNELENLLNEQEFMKINDKYNYLIDIPIYKMTKDELKHFGNEILILKQNYKDTENKSIQQIWLEDIEKLEKMYDKYINTRIEKYKQSIFNDQVKVKKSKK